MRIDIRITSFTTFFNAHPTIWASVKLVVTMVLTIIVVSVVLRLENMLLQWVKLCPDLCRIL